MVDGSGMYEDIHTTRLRLSGQHSVCPGLEQRGAADGLHPNVFCFLFFSALVSGVSIQFNDIDGIRGS